MGYKQLIMPNVNIGATPGWCLKYVDDAVNAPQRTSTAQIAHDSAKAKGWVKPNTDFPKNVWFVLFWSINRGANTGQGHVALAFVNSNGLMQIHDSEVHSGTRGVYSSVAEIDNWFSNFGLVYLGWSIGLDGAQLIASDGNGDNNPPKKEIGEEEMKIVKVLGSNNLYLVKSTGVKHLSGQEWTGVKRVFGFKDSDIDTINQAEFDGVRAAVTYE
ncbi:MAG: hypothetical protein IKG63_05680 [Streptococcus sp.]|nr:hypothetical protein [Streptococcus sp.]